jgi:hypothetical protein
MAQYQTVKTTTILNGQTESGEEGISPQVIVGLYIPTITEAIVYIKVKAEAGDSFVRLQTSDGAGDFSVALSTGGKAIWLPDVAPFSHIKVETSVAQGADREFKFVYKNPSSQGT